MKKYLIIPDCSDYNRGDQALIWETIRIAKDSGFQGEYYMQYAGTDCSQSVSEGIKLFEPVLLHPSRGRVDNNVNYKAVMMRWGAKALLDFISSLLTLCVCRNKVLCKTLLSIKTQETINLFRESTAAFVKGGGFIHSFGGFTAFYFIYYHLYSIYLAHALKVPVYIMPNSFGPIDGFLCKWQVKKALKKCKLVYCREQVSFDYMSLHFPKIQFRKSFDLGLYLEHDLTDNHYQMPDSIVKVAITVRPYRFPEHDNGVELYRDYILNMRGFILWLMKNDYYPVLVQHTLAQNTHEDDMQAIKEITSLLPQNGYGVLADRSFNCRQMKSLYSHFDYIVGTRFHSVIFSMMEGVPAIAIAYGGNKSRGIMKDMGLSEYVIGIDEVETDHLVSLFNKLVDNQDIIKAKLLAFKDIVNEERNRIMDELKQYA